MGDKTVCARAQEQTPSYLPSYTRLGHAIPGSKTVSVGVSRARHNINTTFHHPEQSLLHKLHWLDHVIRVGVFSVSARDTQHTHQHTSWSKDIFVV